MDILQCYYSGMFTFLSFLKRIVKKIPNNAIPMLGERVAVPPGGRAGQSLLQHTITLRGQEQDRDPGVEDLWPGGRQPEVEPEDLRPGPGDGGPEFQPQGPG